MLDCCFMCKNEEKSVDNWLLQFLKASIMAFDFFSFCRCLDDAFLNKRQSFGWHSLFMTKNRKRGGCPFVFVFNVVEGKKGVL